MWQAERWSAFWIGIVSLMAGLVLLYALRDRTPALSVAVLFLPTLFLLGGFLHQLFHVYALTIQRLPLLFLPAPFSVQAGRTIAHFLNGDAFLGGMVAIPFFLASAQLVLYFGRCVQHRILTQHHSDTVMQLLDEAGANRLQNEGLKIARTAQEIETSKWSFLETSRPSEWQHRALTLPRYLTTE